MGLVKDGQLVTVSTVRQSFPHIKEMRDKSQTNTPQSENCTQDMNASIIEQEIQDIISCSCHYCELQKY